MNTFSKSTFRTAMTSAGPWDRPLNDIGPRKRRLKWGCVTAPKTWPESGEKAGKWLTGGFR